jgi:hypothetical protein
MAAEVTRKLQADEEEYADDEYRKFLKEKSQYKDFDEFCREQGI